MNQTAIDLINDERYKQINLGFHSMHDKIVNAAGQLERMARAMLCGDEKLAPTDWNAEAVAKLMKKTGKDKLVTIASLLAAEIDRL